MSHSFTDAWTGVTLTQWTTGSAKHQHLYFTSPSVTADDRKLVLISERDGPVNLYVLDRQSREVTQVSHNTNGALRAYCYPQGDPAMGLGKASCALHAESGNLLYIQDKLVMLTNVHDAQPPREIASLPTDQVTAFTHISHDGLFACVPMTDAQAFADPAADQWQQMRQVIRRFRENTRLRSQLWLVRLDTGEIISRISVRFWVTHVQFQPGRSDRLIFNAEGFGVDIPQRIWKLDLSNNHFEPLFNQEKGTWCSHENFTHEGAVLSHGGTMDEKQVWVQRHNWDGRLLDRFDLTGISLVHATPLRDGRLLIDDRDGRVWCLDPATQTRQPICRHDSHFDDQDAHPHLIPTPGGQTAIFTSCRDGQCHVYETPLPS